MVLAEATAPPTVEPPTAHPQLAGGRPQLSVDQPQEGRLAGAAWARYLEQLAGRDAEADALQDRGAAEGLRDADELDRRRSRDLAVSSRAVAERPVFLALRAGSVFGRAGAASCRWSASHPSRLPISPCRLQVRRQGRRL